MWGISRQFPPSEVPSEQARVLPCSHDMRVNNRVAVDYQNISTRPPIPLVAFTAAYRCCTGGGDRQRDGCPVFARGGQGHAGDRTEGIFCGSQNSARTVKTFVLVEVVTKVVELESLHVLSRDSAKYRDNSRWARYVHVQQHCETICCEREGT